MNRSVSRTVGTFLTVPFALGTGAQGNVRSTTMRAWDLDDFEEVVGMMP